MPNHTVKTHADGTVLPRADQLAWKIAQMAVHNQQADPDVVEMIGNRLIDNAAVAIAAINRQPVRNARLLALGYAHPNNKGARIFGAANDRTFHCEWAALANGVAVRELDMHDTYLAADYSHPGDNIPGLLAVAQQIGANGRDLSLGILTAYETQMALVTGICLHEHKIDHVAHLAPAVAAGIGTMLHMPAEEIYQAVNQSLHLACATRQSRKGDITSWKAYAPAQANKIAIEAVGRVRLGEKAPSPIYEGRDGVIAWMLSGPDAEYSVPLPNPGVAPVGRTHRHPLLPHLVQHRHRLTGRQQVQGPERRVHRLERVRVRAAVLSVLPETEKLIDHRVGFLLSRQLVRGAHRSRRLTASHARGLRPVALLLVAAGKQRVLVRRRVVPRLLVRRRRRVIVLYA